MNVKTYKQGDNFSRARKYGPHCPVHLATAMVLVKERAPKWLMMPDGAEGMALEDGGDVVNGVRKTNDGGVGQSKRFERKYWKCPLAGCFRVESYQLEDRDLEEARRERSCPTCGEPTDASPMQRAVSQFTCKKCVREQKAQKRETERMRQMRLRREATIRRDLEGSEAPFAAQGEAA